MTQNDSWKLYESNDHSDAKKPVVPEANTYGAVLMLALFAAILTGRWMKRRGGS